MKLQFDKNQQYQLDAIQAVIDLFEGQDLNTSDFEFSLSNNAAGSLQFTEAGVGKLFIPEYLTPLFRRFAPPVDKYGLSHALR